MAEAERGAVEAPGAAEAATSSTSAATKGAPAAAASGSGAAAAAKAAAARPDYQKPDWAGAPGPPLRGSSEVALELLVNGEVKRRIPLDVEEYNSFLIGRAKNADVSLEGLEPNSSRFHCVLQCKEGSPELFVYDLGSSHGTSLNGKQLDPRTFVPMKVGEQLRFCADKPAKCVAVLCGPEEAMDEEGEIDLEAFREQAAKERVERERAMNADLQRRKDAKRLRIAKELQQKALAQNMAKQAAKAQELQREALAQSRSKIQEVTWGMGEDAVELPDDHLTDEARDLMDSDGRLDLDKVRERELTDKQQQMVTKLDQKKRKLDNLLREKRRLEENLTAHSKRNEDTEFDVGEPESGRGRGGASMEKLQGIVTKMEKAEEDFSEFADNLLLSMGLRTSSEKSGRISKRRAALYDTRLEEDDDDFYDRTATKKDAAPAQQAAGDGAAEADVATELIGLPNFDGVENRESLERKSGQLKAERGRLIAQIAAEMVKAKKGEEAAAAAGEDEDALDSYMATNVAAIRSDRRAKLERRLVAVDARLAEAASMLRVAVRNAGDGATSAAAAAAQAAIARGAGQGAPAASGSAAAAAPVAAAAAAIAAATAAASAASASAAAARRRGPAQSGVAEVLGALAAKNALSGGPEKESGEDGEAEADEESKEEDNGGKEASSSEASTSTSTGASASAAAPRAARGPARPSGAVLASAASASEAAPSASSSSSASPPGAPAAGAATKGAAAAGAATKGAGASGAAKAAPGSTTAAAVAALAAKPRRPPPQTGMIDPNKAGLQMLPGAKRPAETSQAMPPPSAAPKKRKVYGAMMPPPGALSSAAASAAAAPSSRDASADASGEGEEGA